MNYQQFQNTLFGFGLLGLSLWNWVNISNIRTLQEQVATSKQQSEQDLVIQSLNELNKRLSFVEEGVPEVAKRNAKAKILKAIVLDNIHQTKENNFKSEADLNQYVYTVLDASDRFKVPASLILAIARVESNFNAKAVSPMHAKGIMQIMDDTMAACANRLNKSDYDVFWHRDNTMCGTWYLSYLKANFALSINDTIRAFNCGPKTLKIYAQENLPKETIEYHDRVMQYMQSYKERLYWEN